METTTTGELIRDEYNEVAGSPLHWRTANLEALAGRTVEEVFEMGNGYVVVFTDGTAARLGCRVTHEDTWAEADEWVKPSSR